MIGSKVRKYPNTHVPCDSDKTQVISSNTGTLNTLSVAPGDYVEIRIDNQGNSTGTIGIAVEIVD